MPPHHHKKYSDCYWSELPESALKAAAVLQYTQQTWDEDGKVPYDDKPFADCTAAEKHAAMYLGMSPINKKLDPIYWAAVDATTKTHAIAIGWDEHKWDHDWAIQDLDVEHLYWKELSPEQRQAAAYFGYSPNLWDETGLEEDVFGGQCSGDAVPPPAAAAASSSGGPKKESEEKKDEDENNIAAAVQEIGLEDDSDDEEEEAATAATDSGKTKKSDDKKKIKSPFKCSRPFGSANGAIFDHSNFLHIDQIKVYADKHVIHSMEVTYSGGAVKKAGDSTKGREEVLTFAANEYISAVKVRSNKYVQSLHFQTTTGRWVGPVGGKGWLIGGDKCGEEVAVKPLNKVLSGFKGRADDSHLCQIIFSWGPKPGSEKKN